MNLSSFTKTEQDWINGKGIEHKYQNILRADCFQPTWIAANYPMYSGVADKLAMCARLLYDPESPILKIRKDQRLGTAVDLTDITGRFASEILSSENKLLILMGLEIVISCDNSKYWSYIAVLSQHSAILEGLMDNTATKGLDPENLAKLHETKNKISKYLPDIDAQIQKYESELFGVNIELTKAAKNKFRDNRISQKPAEAMALAVDEAFNRGTDPSTDELPIYSALIDD